MRRWAAAAAVALMAAVLLPLGGTGAQAAFPGAVGRIAFASDRDGGPNIYTMNPDGSNPARVTTHAARDTSPAWHPRGRHILFVSERISGDPDIYRIDDTGGIVRAITETPGVANLKPAYDVDKDVIVFQTNRDGAWEIYSMRTNGKDPKNLTLNPRSRDIDPHVGANDRVVFASNRDRTAGLDIYSMRLDGSDVRRLTRPAEPGLTYEDHSPVWSPDGTRIAFVSTRDGNPEIHLMDANGSNIVRLTEHPGSDLNPAWSPDGRLVAWDTDRHGSREIYLTTADGSQQRRITNNGINDFEPAWQTVRERHAFVADDDRRPVSDGREMGRLAAKGPDTGPSRAYRAEVASSEAAPPPRQAEPQARQQPPEVAVLSVTQTAHQQPPEQRGVLLAVAAGLAALAAFAAGALVPRRRHA